MYCAVLGDSIALGTSAYLPCHPHAYSGINSFNILKVVPQQIHASLVLISLGSNDIIGKEPVDTFANLTELRNRVTAKRVVWLLPNNSEKMQEIVKTIAEKYGDKYLYINNHISGDNIHPTKQGYSELATQFISTF